MRMIIHATKDIFGWRDPARSGVNPYLVAQHIPEDLTEPTEITIINTDGREISFLWTPNGATQRPNDLAVYELSSSWG
jgi:hypothetical protein